MNNSIELLTFVQQITIPSEGECKNNFSKNFILKIIVLCLVFIKTKMMSSAFNECARKDRNLLMLVEY